MTEFKPSRPDVDLLANRLSELREKLCRLSPSDIAKNTSADYLQDENVLTLLFWNSELRISLPDYRVSDITGRVLSSFIQTFALYYLFVADGNPLTGRWVSFAELPDGRIYDRAFQGYTGNELVKKFDKDVEGFKRACETVGGRPVIVGGDSYLFWAFPRVPIVVNYWVGEDEFPSSCKFLFDESVCHYLPIDVCAVLGSNLTGKIVKSS